MKPIDGVAIIVLITLSAALCSAKAADATVSATDQISKLAAATDAPTRATLATDLGDRHIAGRLKLTEEDQKELDRIVARLLQETKTPKTRSEAEKNIQRLWTLAAPGLLKGLDTIDTYSASTRLLTIIKNKDVLTALAAKVRESADSRQKGLLRFALEKMKDHREPDIPDRPGVSQEEGDRLYKTLIEPVLEEME